MSVSFTIGPCAGCCATPVACSGLSCRIRGGTASLCGYSEYTSPSSPPKKYRTQTLGGGTYLKCTYDPPRDVCTSNVSTANWREISGTYKFSGTDCGETNTQILTAGGETADGGCSKRGGTLWTAGLVWNASIVEIDVPNSTITTTQTRTTYDGNGYCVYDGGESGQLTKDLSDEDSETDAKNRLMAGAGGTWGSWIASGAAGCTGTPPSCCVARRETRTTGFSFVYQEAQWAIHITGLTPGAAYSVDVLFYRRTYGTGSYTLYQTHTAAGSADGSGVLDLTGDVPLDAGFETYAACA